MRSLFIIIVLLAGSVQAQSDFDKMLKKYYKYTVPLIQPSLLKEKLDQGTKVVLLDTREKGEFETSHIGDARNVGFDNFSLQTIDDIKKDDVVVVYCTIGARSESIGEQLKKNGYTNVYNLYGGIINWVNAGYSISKDSTPTEDVHVYSKDWGKWLKKGTAVY